MARALEALPEGATQLPFVIPLVQGQRSLSGEPTLPLASLLVMARRGEPWADFLAMDIALDHGDRSTAASVASLWQQPSPLRLPRLARLARYRGDMGEADRLSVASMQAGTVTLRALAERIFTLVSLNRANDALGVLRAYPNVGGPVAKWLRAYVLASMGKIEEGKAIVAQDDGPPELAPPFTKLVALSAYASVRDVRRGSGLVRDLVGAGWFNPDLVAAADKLGLAIPKSNAGR